jgi:hypothetical protein
VELRHDGGFGVSYGFLEHESWKTT